MRRNGVLTLALALALLVGVPAVAQESRFSVGLGASGGEAGPDGGFDIDITGFTAHGAWQIRDDKGWGLMVEIRDGEDDENFVDLDITQMSFYGTYMWRRDATARPFVKFGMSNTDVEAAGGASDDDTSLIVGGGVEIGPGRWAFRAEFDMTEPDLGVDTEVSNVTLGAVFRF